jgi:hypothetical protein
MCPPAGPHMCGPVTSRMRLVIPTAHAPSAGACMHAPEPGPHVTLVPSRMRLGNPIYPEYVSDIVVSNVLLGL